MDETEEERKQRACSQGELLNHSALSRDKSMNYFSRLLLLGL